jgi:hypothetical protein
MSEADVLDLALARFAWNSMVAVCLSAGNARLRWSKSPLPALKNLGELGHADAFGAADRAHIFLDDSAPTAPTAAGVTLFGGSAATTHPLAPPCQRWRRP